MIRRVIVQYAGKLRILNPLDILRGKNPVAPIADQLKDTDYPGCFSKRKQTSLTKRKRKYFMSQPNHALKTGSKGIFL
jgi:hypothetical protein